MQTNFDRMTSRTTLRKPRTSSEVLEERYAVEFETIAKAQAAELDNNNRNGNAKGMLQIKNMLMSSPERHVKHAAAQSFYIMINYTRGKTPDKAANTFASAMAEGDNYTKEVIMRYVRRILMADTRNTGITDEVKNEIEEARKRAGSIIMAQFDKEDSQEMINSVILRALTSGIPGAVEVARNIIAPYRSETVELMPSGSPEGRMDDSKYKRLKLRADNLHAASLIRTVN